MHEDPNYVRAALGAGASGYVLKDAAYEELVDAIRKVADGQAYVAPALGAKLAIHVEHDDDDELSGSVRCWASWHVDTPIKRSRAGCSSAFAPSSRIVRTYL
jgi:hypothetical protein